MHEIPHDHTSEQAVIGAALQGQLNNLTTFGITEEHFFHYKNKLMWREIGKLEEEGHPCKQDTLAHRFAGKDKVESPTPYEVDQAVDHCPSPLLWEYWANNVEVKRKARIVQEAGLKLAQRSGEARDLADLVSEAESCMFDLNQDVASSKPDDRKEQMRRLIDRLQDAHKGIKRGLPTGYQSLDGILGGLEGGRLYVLAARPSVGKSAIAGNIAEKLIMQGLPVGFFSYEMTRDEINLRMLSSISDTDLTGDIINRNKDEEGRLRTMSKTSQHLVDLTKAPLHVVDDAGLTINQLRSSARRMVVDHGIKLLIVDYIQLVKPSNDVRRRDRHLQVAEVTQGLKRLAKELKIPVIGLAQLSREAERNGNQRPNMSMLRESGSLEADADAVMFLWQKDVSMHSGPNVLLKLTVGKNRAGRLGEIDLVLVRNKTRFEEASEPHHTEWLNAKRAEQVNNTR